MVSIIVPNYNHHKFLPIRIESILNQTFQDFELILLDDCSTDGSWEYLESFTTHPKVSHCIRNEINSGSPFKQWKKGIELAKYEWIWIAESDDFCELDFLEKMICNLQTDVSLIFSKSKFVDANGSQLNLEDFKIDESKYDFGDFDLKRNGIDFIKKFLLYRNSIVNVSSVLFKKPSEFPEEILEMKFAGDWFLWITLLCKGKVYYCSEELNYFRFHAQTTRFQKSESLELDRYHEFFSCIYYAKRILKLSGFSLTFDYGFSEIILNYFKVKYKYGRSRLVALFPDIPWFFYPLYYRFFFKSFIQSHSERF
ncbi:Glycosyltransferase involved in cell wall bisynthesis [Algoriphagus alkaliphilus]|uniref:Glycosyltransferase involved in cell wall bisynthesis n=1 Tax=Algoriphagus alkaliphilus TaxID=279824 RepID=A0A1G5ZP72_9BACT|nr:glycosyltransferase family 2 protein [Algoriphagus alkaliphilus]SDA96360.1 Glycosyltransferase involved in cell wall bisynthesis [Algoriphagus alkaliphilus]